MSYAVITEVDTSGFERMASALADFSGKTFEQVLVHQAGMLLKACIRRTPVRKIGVITKRVSKRNGYIVFQSGHAIRIMKSESAGEAAKMFLDDSTFDRSKMGKGGKLPVLINGKSWHNMENKRWSNARWSRFQSFETEAKNLRKNRLKDAIAARGLAKKTWVQIAEALGLHLDGVPSYVKNSKGPGGRQYKEGFARRVLEASARFIELTNANPIMGKLHGAQILQGAIRDRLKAFEIEMSKGVFMDLKTRAKRYPGIFTD